MKLRPRFSLRTLAILVTLVCAYFAAWEATEKYGATSQTSTRLVNHGGINYSCVVEIIDTSSPLPFVVRRDEYEFPDPPMTVVCPPNRRYYLWLFGGYIRLPVRDKELPHPEYGDPAYSRIWLP